MKRVKYASKRRSLDFRLHLNLNFSGGACPQTPLGSSHLQHLRSRLPPTFPVGTSTSKLIDSTAILHLLRNYQWFLYLKATRSILIPLDGMLHAVCSRVTPGINSLVHIYKYTWMARGTVIVKCSCPITQVSVPSQGSNPYNLIQIRVHKP